jgi:nitroreductase
VVPEKLKKRIFGVFMSKDITAAFDAVINSRRSVRGFLPDQVPSELMEKVFTQAQRSPSNCNTQPWSVAVVSGERRDKLREMFCEAMKSGEMNLDFPYDGAYDGEYKNRQHGSAKALYDAMGVTRDDKAGRGAAFMRNFEFFDAPHVAFLFLPEEFGLREAADLGMYAQSLMLSLTANGLASCAQTALSMHCDQLRGELGLEDNLKLVFGISFGYEDSKHAANQCRVNRAPLDEVVQFFD